MKKYLAFAFFASLTARTQEIPEQPNTTANKENGVSPNPLTQVPIPVPEVNDANCKFEYMKSISDKYIQQTLADNCARRSTLKPTKHKNWVF